MHIDDFTNAVDLLVAVIKRLDWEMVEQLRGA
jgi:putative aminopeptidase FrvX